MVLGSKDDGIGFVGRFVDAVALGEEEISINLADGFSAVEELCFCLGEEVAELADEGFLTFGMAGTVLAKDIGVFGFDGDDTWAIIGILVADDGVHGGFVAEIIFDVGMEVFKAYFGDVADGDLWEDGLYDVGDEVFFSFLHELDEGAEEIEGHGLTGEEVVEEAVLFDGLVFLFAGDSLLGVLEREGCEEVFAADFSSCNHADLQIPGTAERAYSHRLAEPL